MYQERWRKAVLIAEQAMRLQPDGSRSKAYSLVNLGAINAELDHFRASAANFTEALDTLQEMNDRCAVGTVVGEIGILLCRSGDNAHAVQLWESSSRIREETRCPLPKNEARRMDSYVAKACEALGADEYDNQAYAGRQIIESEAVELATDLCRALIESVI